VALMMPAPTSTTSVLVSSSDTKVWLSRAARSQSRSPLPVAETREEDDWGGCRARMGGGHVAGIPGADELIDNFRSTAPSGAALQQKYFRRAELRDGTSRQRSPSTRTSSTRTTTPATWPLGALAAPGEAELRQRLPLHG
jgi:hypothetical protein